jgi:hypothetical protein
MTMINPNVLKAVHDLLQERGIEQQQNESLSDYIARGLNLSDGETVRLLEALDSGMTIEEAQQEAGVTLTPEYQGLALSIARAIGTVLGKMSS